MGEFILVVLFLILYIEFMNRGSIKGVYLWIKNDTISFIYNILLVYSVAYFIEYFTGNIKVTSIVVTLVLMLIGYSNKYKLKFKGEEFYPWDILNVREIIYSYKYAFNL